MEDEFLAVLKLVSGEEVMAMVMACPEEDRIILALDHPIMMKEQETSVGTVIRVEPWIKFDNDSLYFIDMDKVITMTEVTSNKIINVYNEYIKEVSIGSNKVKVKPSRKLGYISTLEDFRKDLEKLYKSSNN